MLSQLDAWDKQTEKWMISASVRRIICNYRFLRIIPLHAHPKSNIIKRGSPKKICWISRWNEEFEAQVSWIRGESATPNIVLVEPKFICPFSVNPIPIPNNIRPRQNFNLISTTVYQFILVSIPIEILLASLSTNHIKSDPKHIKNHTFSGWWYTYPSEKYKNIQKSVGMITFPIYGKS